jgi:hypothetical protein
MRTDSTDPRLDLIQRIGAQMDHLRFTRGLAVGFAIAGWFCLAVDLMVR